MVLCPSAGRTPSAVPPTVKDCTIQTGSIGAGLTAGYDAVDTPPTDRHGTMTRPADAAPSRNANIAGVD